MKEVNTTVYHCGYCKEYYLRKSAAAKHEERCRNNPKNQHKCWGCAYLKSVHVVFDFSDYAPDRKFKSFVCTAQEDLPVYSFRAENKQEFIKMLIDMKDEDKQSREPIRMPLSCELYEQHLGF